MAICLLLLLAAMLQRGMLLYAQVPNYLSPYSVAYVATSQSPLLYKGKGYSEGHPLASLAKRLHLPPPPRQPLPYGQPPWRNKTPRAIACRAAAPRLLLLLAVIVRVAICGEAVTLLLPLS